MNESTTTPMPAADMSTSSSSKPKSKTPKSKTSKTPSSSSKKSKNETSTQIKKTASTSSLKTPSSKPKQPEESESDSDPDNIWEILAQVPFPSSDLNDEDYVEGGGGGSSRKKKSGGSSRPGSAAKSKKNSGVDSGLKSSDPKTPSHRSSTKNQSSAATPLASKKSGGGGSEKKRPVSSTPALVSDVKVEIVQSEDMESSKIVMMEDVITTDASNLKNEVINRDVDDSAVVKDSLLKDSVTSQDGTAESMDVDDVKSSHNSPLNEDNSSLMPEVTNQDAEKEMHTDRGADVKIEPTQVDGSSVNIDMKITDEVVTPHHIEKVEENKPNIVDEEEIKRQKRKLEDAIFNSDTDESSLTPSTSRSSSSPITIDPHPAKKRQIDGGKPPLAIATASISAAPPAVISPSTPHSMKSKTSPVKSTASSTTLFKPSHASTSNNRNADVLITIPGPGNRARTIPRSKINTADRSGRTIIFRYASLGDVAAVNELITVGGADINVRDHAGWSPLHEACLEGRTEVVDILIRYGADVSCAGMDGDTPLHDAVTNGHCDVAELLLKYGALLNLTNKKGQTPLDIAEEEDEDDDVKDGDKEGDQNNDDGDDDDYKFLPECATGSKMKRLLRTWKIMLDKISQVDDHGCTLLHQYAREGDLKGVQRALKFGSDVDFPDYAGWTSLHEACSHGFSDIVHELLEHSASPNCEGGIKRNEQGGVVEHLKITPVMDAAYKGHVGVVKMLLEYGADPLRKNAEGKTAVDFVGAENASTTTAEEEEVERLIEIKKLLDRPKSSWQPFKVPAFSKILWAGSGSSLSNMMGSIRESTR